LPWTFAAEPAVRFFAFGDLPYSAPEREMLKLLLSQVVAEEPPFLAHIGDVKAGNSPCTLQELGRTADLFRTQPVPVVFTPGDNEWTDCRRSAAGGYDPVERLSVLRSLYFSNPQVLRLHELGISRQDPAYPENYWFVREGIIFVTLHLVGSDNTWSRAMRPIWTRSWRARRRIDAIFARLQRLPILRRPLRSCCCFTPIPGWVSHVRHEDFTGSATT
jgi:hypothetical protein